MFRFTLQDVLWLVLVAALALGWWLDSISKRRKAVEAQDNLVILQGDIEKLEKENAVLRAAIEQLKAAAAPRIP